MPTIRYARPSRSRYAPPEPEGRYGAPSFTGRGTYAPGPGFSAGLPLRYSPPRLPIGQGTYAPGPGFSATPPPGFNIIPLKNPGLVGFDSPVQYTPPGGRGTYEPGPGFSATPGEPPFPGFEGDERETAQYLGTKQGRKPVEQDIPYGDWRDIAKRYGVDFKRVVDVYLNPRDPRAADNPYDAIRSAVSDDVWGRAATQAFGRPPNQLEWREHYYAKNYGSRDPLEGHPAATQYIQEEADRLQRENVEVARQAAWDLLNQSQTIYE